MNGQSTIFDPSGTAVIMYGVGDAVVAYMVPFPPQETKPWPGEYIPYVPPAVSPYVFPTPDALSSAMKELQSLGLTATDSLRLISIVNWECARAVEIAKACRKDGIWDILLFAKELMNK